MKIRVLFLFLLIGIASFGQNFWSVTKLDQKELKANKKIKTGERLYAIDLGAMMNHLQNANGRNDSNTESNLTIEIPNIYGKTETYKVVEASNFSSELQAQYPNIRSYRGVKTHNPQVTIAFSVAPIGFQAMRTEVGQPTTFIEAVTTDNSVYTVFEKTDKSPDWECSTPDELLESEIYQAVSHVQRDADDQVLRDFRLALSCTGEYGQYFGGTVAGALAGMNATMTRVNPILEREVAIHLTMIENNADVIYTDPSTDPYSPATDAGMGNWNQELQTNLNDVIGSANYDIGHLFGASGGGGNAGCIGCVCNAGKGSAFTSPYDGIPEGDNFDVDYVIHEMGHQLGANHTFSRYENSGVNYEPGSGSTIMGYAGITGSSTDVQAHSDDYFHSASIRQITNNVKNKTCPTETPINNQPPTADAGSDYYIPIGTPFKLEGSGSDPDNDNISFCWEQIDSSNSGTGFEVADPNSTTNPLVRSMLPTTVPTRYIPAFEKVLEGNLYSSFESLSIVDREMNFNLQLRDNNPEIGQTDSDAMVVNVLADGGIFKVTEPTGTSTVVPGDLFEVTWDVAQTNEAPINTSHVNIYLSTDGGNYFDIIASNVENNGSATVIIPAGIQTMDAILLIESVGNIFYTISDKFNIGYQVTSECYSYEATGLPLDIADGNGANVYGNYAVGRFNVADHGAFDELTIEIDIAHTWVEDLQVVLQSPSPTQTVKLWDRECGGQDNLILTFDDNGSPMDCNNLTNSTIIPSNPLSAFSGFQTQGTWNIGVRDGYNGDTGTFNAATATFCSYSTSPLGTNDIASTVKSQINVYPNPSKGIFNFELDTEGSDLTYRVFDVTGKLLTSNKEANVSGRYNQQIDLSSYPKGTYILQVVNGKKIINKKLLVK